MCRPIESRDSLGAAAVFAGYASQGNKVNANASPALNGVRNIVNMPWSPSSSMGFGGPNAEGMNVMSMAGPPPSLPFVSSFPKNIPWAQQNAEIVNLPFVDEQMNQMNAMNNMVSPQFLPPMEQNIATQCNAEAMEAAELEELLDFSLPDENGTEKDKEELINLDDGFDGTEMSILYSFLVDAPQEKVKDESPLNVEDDGLLNLNLLSSSPLDSFMDSFDLADEVLQSTPAAAAPVAMFRPEATLEKATIVGEVKSRRLCKAEGCYKRSRSNGLCICHGGGRRCAVDGCDKSSQGGNLCIRHGGGKRCHLEGCDKAAQSNFLCKAHGGGPRCRVDGCSRSSQGGGYCRSHGGGKRCMFDGCTKGTQRGDYCALHGGSRLCEVPGCMRNDRGGGLCATHGGGKRCTIDGCVKPCRRKGFCSAHLRQMENANKD